MEFSNMQLGLLMGSNYNRSEYVETICGIAMKYCTGNNTVYSSYGDCAQFLGTIPDGTWYRVNSNSVVCRYYHAALTTVDPDGHCSHISRPGGGKCIEFPYSYFYERYY